MFWNFLASYKKRSGSRHLPDQSGFGLIELMVSIGILTLVMSMILIQQNAFNGAVLLRNQVYEIAFDAREVQLSALGSTGGKDSIDFREVRGLYFDTAAPTGYQIFQDTGNNYFDGGEAYGAQGVLDKRFQIESITAMTSVGPISLNNVSVVFQRPNFDALFYTAANTRINATLVEVKVRRIGAEASDTGPGAERALEISSTGQITVK